MTKPPPVLHARRGGAGEILLNIACSYSDRVRIWYGVWSASDVVWTLGPAFTHGGSQHLTGMSDDVNYVIFAVLESADGVTRSYPSNLACVQPRNPNPIFDIELYRYPIELYPAQDVIGYRLRIETRNPVNMPKEIFLYQKERDSDPVGELEDSFVTVCTPADIEQFPTVEPMPAEPPFYRRDTIDVVVESAAEADEIWTTVKSAVDGLKMALEEIRRMDPWPQISIWAGREEFPSLSSMSFSSSSDQPVSSSSSRQPSSSSSEQKSSSSSQKVLASSSQSPSSSEAVSSSSQVSSSVSSSSSA